MANAKIGLKGNIEIDETKATTLFNDLETIAIKHGLKIVIDMFQDQTPKLAFIELKNKDSSR